MSRMRVAILCTILVSSLSGCGREEIGKLRGENEALKAKIALLEQENQELKQTDHSHFSRAVDALNVADSKSSLQAAVDGFTQLINKFPHSQYVPEARQHIGDLRKRISVIDRSQMAMAKFDFALIAHNFDEATKQLTSLKALVTVNEHMKLYRILVNEKNKPLETTINKLVSDFGTLRGSTDMRYFDLIGMKVRFKATFSAIDRNRKELRAHSTGYGEGSAIDVYYDGTSLEAYFTNNDPKCCDNRYIVTGKTNIYRNTFDLYVKAEEIEVIRH